MKEVRSEVRRWIVRGIAYRSVRSIFLKCSALEHICSRTGQPTSSVVSSRLYENRPTIPDLNKHATPFIAAYWYKLGLELLDSQQRKSLKEIEKTGNVYRCCIRMFSEWLNTSHNATWNQLIEATRRIDLEDIANDIQSSLLGMC